MEKVPSIADLKVIIGWAMDYRHLLRLWRQIIEDDKRIKRDGKSPKQLRRQWENQNMREQNAQVEQWGGIKARGNKIGSNLYKPPTTSGYQTSSTNPGGEVLQDTSPSGFIVENITSDQRVQRDINREGKMPLVNLEAENPFLCPECGVGLRRWGVRRKESGYELNTQRFRCPQCGAEFYLPLTVMNVIYAYNHLGKGESLILCLPPILPNV